MLVRPNYTHTMLSPIFIIRKPRCLIWISVSSELLYTWAWSVVPDPLLWPKDSSEFGCPAGWGVSVFYLGSHLQIWYRSGIATLRNESIITSNQCPPDLKPALPTMAGTVSIFNFYFYFLSFLLFLYLFHLSSLLSFIYWIRSLLCCMFVRCFTQSKSLSCTLMHLHAR